MTNEQLAFIEMDLKLLIKDNFHPKHLDLINIFKEDLNELINFVKHINNVLKLEHKEVSGQYDKGYWDGIEQIKREIYNKQS